MQYTTKDKLILNEKGKEQLRGCGSVGCDFEYIMLTDINDEDYLYFNFYGKEGNLIDGCSGHGLKFSGLEYYEQEKNQKYVYVVIDSSTSNPKMIEDALNSRGNLQLENITEFGSSIVIKFLNQ